MTIEEKIIELKERIKNFDNDERKQWEKEKATPEYIEKCLYHLKFELKALENWKEREITLDEIVFLTFFDYSQRCEFRNYYNVAREVCFAHMKKIEFLGKEKEKGKKSKF